MLNNADISHEFARLKIIESKYNIIMARLSELEDKYYQLIGYNARDSDYYKVGGSE